MNSKASGPDKRFVELFDWRVVVFISAENRKNVALLSSKLPKALAISVVFFYAANKCLRNDCRGSDLISDALPFLSSGKRDWVRCQNKKPPLGKALMLPSVFLPTILCNKVTRLLRKPPWKLLDWEE